MGKRTVFSKIKKCIVFLLVLLVFVASVKGENRINLQEFFQAGKTHIKNGIIERMLYSQSVILGILPEQNNPWQNSQVATRVEGFLPFEEDEIFIFPEDSVEEAFRQENEQAISVTKEEVLLSKGFVPAEEKQRIIKKEDYKELAELVKGFYTVDPTTSVDESFLNVEDLLSVSCAVDKETAGPQILIYHTHSQEAFVDSRPGTEEDTIVGAGEILAEYLEGYGFQVYHHKKKYDVESRDYAYSNALPEVEQLLKDNPGIKVVIDLHRDAVAEDTKLITQIQGREMAKVMFFNGLGRTKANGEISYLKNPYLKENLAFSFQMKMACDEYYPGFARNIYLRAYRYNMHLCPKTLLIELGAQTNTKEEIANALEPLAHVLSMVLSGEYL